MVSSKESRLAHGVFVVVTLSVAAVTTPSLILVSGCPMCTQMDGPADV